MKPWLFVLLIALTPLLILADAPTNRAPITPPPSAPGAINPSVTQANIHQTICVSGWSAKQRPPTSYTEPIKLKLLRGSGYTDQNPHSYELDHEISIENGGSPTDPKNLWLQSYVGACNAHVKDKLENALHRLVCAGKITLQQDQEALRGDWTLAYRKYVGPISCP